MIGANAEHVPLASLAQIPLDIADTVHRIGRDPTKRDASSFGTRNHLRRQLGLGRKANLAWH